MNPIFYSFISNSSLSQSLGNISKISDEVGHATYQIEKFLDHANELEKSSAENTKALREVSGSVETHIVSLKEALQDISSNTELLQDSMGRKIDLLGAKLAEANNEKSSRAADVGGEKSDMSELLQMSSLIGRFLIYACALSHSKSKSFTISQFATLVDFSKDYIWGYLVALTASRCIQANEGINDDNFIHIVAMDETLKSEVKASLLSGFEERFAKNDTIITEYQ